ncbi:MAG: ATP-binding protein [Fibrobacterota bacterium]|nr:ATP-binding protein [Fibrobacterota bacterium]
MIPRLLLNEVQESLAHFPVVGLLGARQVGKTTVAKAIAAQAGNSLYLDLEKPSDLNRISDPELFLSDRADKLVILDEIHRVPELFAVLRALVDEKRKPGRFLILGSASPDLLRQSSESLAGRIRYLELSPLSLRELKQPYAHWRKHWLQGGYPDSYLAKTLKQSVQWRNAFIQTHLERDIPGFGIRIPAARLRRFWLMLAHLHGQTWNASQIAASLQVTAPSANHYLDILEDTFMVRRLQPFHSNLKKRLVKAPKIYLRDSGMLHALLGLDDADALQGHPSAGFSWEGWALEQVLSWVPSSWRPSFFRTGAGAEIDLILERPGRGGPIAVEFRYSMSPQVSSGFWQSLQDVKASKAFVVAPVKEAYPLKEGVTVLPVHALEPILTH